MSKVHIKSERPGHADIVIDGQRLPGVASLGLHMSAGKVTTVLADVIVSQAEIETDAELQMVTQVNGKKYKLVEIE
jgi:hypothetical protein